MKWILYDEFRIVDLQQGIFYQISSCNFKMSCLKPWNVGNVLFDIDDQFHLNGLDLYQDCIIVENVMIFIINMNNCDNLFSSEMVLDSVDIVSSISVCHGDIKVRLDSVQFQKQYHMFAICAKNLHFYSLDSDSMVLIDTKGITLIYFKGTVYVACLKNNTTVAAEKSNEKAIK